MTVGLNLTSMPRQCERGRRNKMSLIKIVNGYAKVACVFSVVALIVTVFTEGKNFVIPKFAFIEVPLLWLALAAFVIPFTIVGYICNPEKKSSPS